MRRIRIQGVLFLAAAAAFALPWALQAPPRPYGNFARDNARFSGRAARPPDYGLFAADGLGREVAAALNISFLLARIGPQPPAASLGPAEKRPGYTRFPVTLRDNSVGDLKARLLLPDGLAGAAPAVLCLPGHGDNFDIIERTRLGRELAGEGYAVLIPEFRLYDLGPGEQAASRELLDAGFTLMGLRVYEALLWQRWLASLPVADRSAVGVLAHSGGSAVARLAARLVPPAALVTDYRLDYRESATGPLHGEMVPALVPLSGAVNNTATLPVPHMTLPYSFGGPRDRALALDFFASALKGRGALPADPGVNGKDLLEKARNESREPGLENTVMADIGAAVAKGLDREGLRAAAGLYSLLGEPGAAVLVLRSLEKDRPGDPEIKLELAAAAAAAGDAAEARRALLGIGRLAGPEQRRRRAIVLQDIGDIKEALLELRRLAAELPSDPVISSDLRVCERIAASRR